MRRRIIHVATEQFVRHGYLTTTMGGIAEGAGVAVQTIYLAFGSKVGLLSAAHDVALAGDDEPVPLLKRDWAQRLGDMPTASAALAQVLEHQLPSTARVAPIYAVIQSAAADPEVAELLATLREQRHHFSHTIAERLLAAPATKGPAAVDRVADILYATITPETYALFVIERGWPASRWRAWLHDVVLRELVD